VSCQVEEAEWANGGFWHHTLRTFFKANPEIGQCVKRRFSDFEWLSKIL